MAVGRKPPTSDILEPATHFLFGACLSRAGFNRKSALATTTMVLAAEAADLDIITYFKGPIFGFAHHRGITHTLVGAPFVAAFVVGGMYLGHRIRNRKRPEPPSLSGLGPMDAAAPPDEGPHTIPRWGILYAGALLAALSHILLDYTNAYGVRPFEPFSYRWYSWDIVSIIEPALYFFFFCGLVLPWLFRMINEEIGSKRRGPRGRAGAIFALAGVCCVWGLRDFEHRRALDILDGRLYQGDEAVRVSAYPYEINPFKWYGVAETETFFDRVQVDTLAGEVDPHSRERIRYKPQETEASLAAKRSYYGRVYLDWAAYPVTEVEHLERPGGGWLVRIFDLRYQYPEREGESRILGGGVEMNEKFEVLEEWFGRKLPPAAPASP